MSFILVVVQGVQEAQGKVKAQKQKVSTGLDQIKSYTPVIQSNWEGSDADAYAADVVRKIVPATLELIAAIAGVDLNLTKSMDLVSQADTQSKGLASQLGDVFGQIF
jgi:WXG100 family type VII secretion target